MHISFIIIAASIPVIIASAIPPVNDPGNLLRHRLGPLRQRRATNVSCTTDNDCGDHGTCRNSNCRCDPGYITWETSSVCAYHQVSKLLVFLLSFFLGSLGVDWFLLAKGNAAYLAAGIFKLLMGCGCCVGICARVGKALDESGVFAGICACCSLLVSCGASVWWLVDWIRILTDTFNDGNGAPLGPW